MARDPKIALLRNVPGLRQYRDRDLARIAPLVDEADIAEGEVLIEQGRAGLSAYIIVDGEALVTVGDKEVGRLGAGDFVGEMALLDHSPRSATVTAVTEMRVLAMNPQSFATILNQPNIGWRVAAGLAERLRRVEGAPTYTPGGSS